MSISINEQGYSCVFGKNNINRMMNTNYSSSAKSIRRYRDSTISISKNKQGYSCLFLKTLNFHAYSNVEVDEPGEGVLVHGVYGGQV